MDQKLWKFIGAPECGKCNMGTLFKGAHQFSEAVTLKTKLIEKAGLSATSLLPDVYLFRDLVRDALSHRYNELSLLGLEGSFEFDIRRMKTPTDFKKICRRHLDHDLTLPANPPLSAPSYFAASRRWLNKSAKSPATANC